jgi:hypothetical protein
MRGMEYIPPMAEPASSTVDSEVFDAASTGPVLPEPIEALARLLYEEMERLAPGVDDYVPWDDLDASQRSFHLHVVARLLSERDLIRCALANADDHLMDR